MSNVYIQEPPTHGKVLLETTAGDIDVELWSREAPKACRNFIQLCMEGYYNQTIFHRLVQGFIVQGGDPTGTGEGGNSIWGKPFKDEFHSRLRFSHRGLVAMANAGKDDNGSQFFFTLAPTPELQNKHTIFGKVAGNTVYNMLKLGDGETDSDERPNFPYKITGAKILMNPFEDIQPRQTTASVSSRKSKDKKEAGTKNFKLLSFGEEAEEAEEEAEEVNKKFSGKSKSSHDLTNDPKLSSEVAPDLRPAPHKSSRKRKHEDKLKRKHKLKSGATGSGSGSESKSDSGSHSPADSGSGSGSESSDAENVEEESRKKAAEAKRQKSLKEVQDKLSKTKQKEEVKKSPGKREIGGDKDDDGSYYLGKDEEIAKKKRVTDLKKEYRDLKSGMRQKEAEKLREEAVAAEAKVAKEAKQNAATDNNLIQDFMKEQKEYKEKTAGNKIKGSDREAATLALLQKFQKKLDVVKQSTEAETAEEAAGDTDEVNDPLWLAKGLSNEEEEEPVLAKDANLKGDDWYGLDDPRNPIVQRRRHEAKRQAQANRPSRRDLI